LDEGRRTGGWLFRAALVVAAAELLTNVLPMVLTTMADPSPATAHALTVAEDFADALLFIAIAFFSFVAALDEQSWVRIFGLVVGGLCGVRAFASPLGMTALDAVAPIAFLLFVLVLSVRMLINVPGRSSQPLLHTEWMTTDNSPQS